jgi:tetratricopeptide (TPR) repeat protein
MRRGVRRVGWAVLASCVAGVSTLLAATTPAPPKPADAAPAGDGVAAEPSPAAANPAEKPPTLLDVALLSADRWAIARMRSESDNLTWQSMQLADLTRLLARARRFDQALALIRDLDTPERVKVEAYAPIVAAALRAGDKARALALTEKVTGIEEWTTSPALAEIARAMDAAGDRAGALRLAAKIPAGADRATTLFEMGRYVEATAAARNIAPGSFHVDCGGDGSHCWVDDWAPRQEFLVKLVKALVDEGDLRGAHAAMAALDEVDGFGTPTWRARALVEIARREEPVATLRQALAALDDDPILIPGDRTAKAETYARIAAGFAAAGQRAQAVELLPKALGPLGPIDSLDTLQVSPEMACASLARIARVHFAVGQREEALALLARAERLIDAVVVPPPKESDGSSWDFTASTQHDRVVGKLYLAVTLEAAGERERAEKAMTSLLAELATIRSSEWREYAWQSMVEAYSEAGRLDRALELLSSGQRGDAERWLAIHSISDEDLVAAPRPQLWGLLDALPPGGGKADLATRLAILLDAQGERTGVTRAVTEALGSLAAMAARRDTEWQLSLIDLGGKLPGAERPGNAEQQRLLRELLAVVKAQPVAAAKLAESKN